MLAAAPLALGLLLTAFATPSQEPYFPDEEHWLHLFQNPQNEARSYQNGDFAASILVDVEGKAIAFWWKHMKDAGFLDNSIERHVETEAVAYWPTGAEWVSDMDLLVSGISTKDGSIIVERWTYQPPTANLPRIIPVLNENTGEQGYAWKVPKRTAVQVVFTGANAQFGGVSMMKENLGRPDSAYVRFFSNGDINLIDWSGSVPQATVAASATVSSGVLHVPPLAETRWDKAFGAVDANDGFVIVLLDWSTGDRIFLIDSDEDGDLDLWAPWDPQDKDKYVLDFDPSVIESF